MELVVSKQATLPDENTDIIADSSVGKSLRPLNAITKKLIWYAIKIRIFYFACIILKQPRKIWQTYKAMLTLRNTVWAGDLKKIYKIDGRYYFNQYTPGWPSAEYDQLIQRELKRRTLKDNTEGSLSFIFFAITRKCPMRCEHCFEWDNLNQKESFTKEDLLKVVDLFQKEGVLQFHFSGGEPMVRFKDLIEVIRHASQKSECWVVTSGFNVNDDTARQLKEAGCKGMVVSIDHYIPDMHNRFRGNPGSFQQASAAIGAAKKARLVTSVSVCATKTFLDGGHLLPYLDFAKSLGVQFVQVLEPRSVGRYEGRDVALESRHLALLEQVFRRVNHDAAYKAYPTLLYHGYHQRRIGCFSGSRSVYVDSVGDVHACPFCHTRAYNIIPIVRNNETQLPGKQNSCPQFDKIA